ncbi:hypothetical protein SDC9_90198 [bioreactor metagenome]|uniref:Uncharacterized protein n=1 Tax=bioreactor metagenome TaxID=1076179 RepID=A0A644ZUF1_9ZZZZ
MLYFNIFFELLYFFVSICYKKVSALLEINISVVFKYFIGMLVKLYALFCDFAVHFCSPLHSHPCTAPACGAAAYIVLFNNNYVFDSFFCQIVSS